MADCPHLNFNAFVSVGRIGKSDGEPDVIVAYVADIRVKCRDCEQPFEFIGVPNGMSFYQPTVSIDGQEVHIPLAIPGTMPPDGLAGFSVTHQAFDQPEPVKQ